MANPSFHIVAPAKHPPQRTAVVLGTARGGTSCVAAVLDALGVYMGPPEEMTEVFEFRELCGQNEPNWGEVVVRENARHDVWGWKNPNGTSVAASLPKETRNPYGIVVLRDPAAVAAWRAETVGWDVAVSHAAYATWELLHVLEQWKHPKMVCSFERMRRKPAEFVEALDAFLGLGSSEQTKATAVARIGDTYWERT